MHKIDLKDRRILYELDLDSRQSNKQIAKKVGLSEQVVGNRIKRLLDNKIIDYFNVKLNSPLIGYTHIKVYLRLHNITKEEEINLINELKKSEGIIWVASLRGKYDLIATIYLKDILQFSKRYTELFENWSDKILDRNIIIVESGAIYTKSCLLPNISKKEAKYRRDPEEFEPLDNTNKQLLKLLNMNARKNLVELGKNLNLSPDAIKYRINNLKKKKVITQFSAKINFNELGHNYHILALKMHNMNQKKHQKLKTIADLNKNVIYFIKTIGSHDIEFELETINKEELDIFIRKLRDEFPAEIKDYEIIEVTKEHRLAYVPF